MLQENRRRQQQQQQQSSGAGASGSRPQQPGYQQQSSSGQDDREGVLNHPKRGRIPTYIFQVTSPLTLFLKELGNIAIPIIRNYEELL